MDADGSGDKVEETRLAVGFEELEDVVDDLDDTVLRRVDLGEEGDDLRIRHETARKRWEGGLADARRTRKSFKQKTLDAEKKAVR